MEIPVTDSGITLPLMWSQVSFSRNLYWRYANWTCNGLTGKSEDPVHFAGPLAFHPAAHPPAISESPYLAL